MKVPFQSSSLSEIISSLKNNDVGKALVEFRILQKYMRDTAERVAVTGKTNQTIK